MTKILRLVAITIGLLVALLPLAGGRVLAAGTWSLTGSMNSARAFHTATPLNTRSTGNT